MTSISIHSTQPQQLTLISNVFLDHYMPAANGEFVKIYLYLVRALADGQPTFSLEAAADIFSCTENDIIRALRYWENTGLLSLTFNSKNQITGLSLAAQETVHVQPNANPPAEPATAPEKKKTNLQMLSPARITELKNKDGEIQQLLYICEQYMGKPLSPIEISRILYFYDTLHFSPDLIEYLIEYCVSKGHTSMHYIEKVGTEWHKAGIRTIDMAKSETNTWSKNYFSILKAFGIRNRSPVEQEIKYIDHWLNDYNFTTDILCEACSRTITSIGKSSFDYADKILESWKNSGVRKLEDIAALDERHKNKQTAAPQSPIVNPKNRFNNFNQRDYDYDELEKQLLLK